MSLYTSASGIQGHDQWMGVIGSNISNSGTIGYQRYEYEFADYMYKTTPAGSVGMGGGFGSVKRNTESGVPMPTSVSSHLAINGNGYFRVQDSNNQTYYSRAGIFNFDKNGVYTDPMGNHVMGFPIDASGNVSKTEQAITLPADSRIPPQASTSIKVGFNLGSEKQVSAQSLFDGWDNGISSTQFGEQVDFSIYTPSGKKQKVTVYFDAVETNTGEKVYEYAVAISAEDDTRDLGTSNKKGLLMTGAMVFDSGGTLQNMSALVPSNTPDDLTTWKNASLNGAGVPVVSLPLSGGTQNISLDFGMSSPIGAFKNTGNVNPLFASFLENPKRGEHTSTAYAGNSLTEYMSVDGSAEGLLQNVRFNQSGILTAQYSNGENIDLYQLNLYTFQGTDALNDIGNGLYAYDALKGGDIYGNPPGSNGAGLVQGGYLEQSNVDIAEELTYMILCQTSLSANTKMFTTIDEMLQVAVKL